MNITYDPLLDTVALGALGAVVVYGIAKVNAIKQGQKGEEIRQIARDAEEGAKKIFSGQD